MNKGIILSALLLVMSQLLSAQVPGPLFAREFQSAPARTVLAGSKPLVSQAGQPVAILYRQALSEFQKDESLKATQRLVFLVQTAEGARNWSHVQVGWSPWHEEKPKVQVRVTNPDGQQFWVRTQDLMEVSGQADDGNIYSDARLLKGPLPQIKEGSVVEQEIVYNTKPTLAGGGILRFWPLAGDLPEAHITLTISHPDTTVLNYKAVGTGKWSQSESIPAPGFTAVTYTASDIPAFKFAEGNLPPGEILWPGVVYSTAPEWKTLGRLYAAQVEDLLNKFPLSAPAGVVTQAGSPREKVNRYLHWIDTKVRYTGLELGVNAIVPVSPDTVLSRGYGDCKDKALLLVSLLRQSGVDADITLIKTGPGQDVYPLVPGLDHFNHAIVRVQDKEPFFVDPTVEYNRQGLLPYWDQNRQVLVASARGGEALRTPTAFAEMNLTRLYREVNLGDEGTARLVRDVVTYQGDYEIFYRNRYAGETPDQRKKRQESYASGVLRGEMTKSDQQDTGDLSRPFEYSISVKDSGLGYTEGETSSWEFDWSELKGWIPDVFLEKQENPRIRPFQYNLPFRVIWEQKITPPVGFKLRAVPELPQGLNGPFLLQSQGTTEADGSYKLTVTLDSGPVYVSPADFEKARNQWASFFTQNKSVKVIFDHEAGRLIQGGNYREAFDTYRRLASLEPEKAIHRTRLSSALLRVGLGDEALKYAEEAVRLEPENDRAWANLAWTLEFNPLGRRFGKGFDRERAAEAFRKAAGLNPQAWFHRANLAVLLEVDANGIRYGSRDVLTQARKEYETLGRNLENGELEENYLLVLFLLEDFRALEQKASASGKKPLKDLYGFLAGVGLRGLEPALNALDPQLDQDKKSALLTSAGEKLIRNRQYTLAAEVFRTASLTKKDTVDLDYRADNLSKTNRTDFDPVLAKTPEDVVRQYLAGLVLGDGRDFSRLSSILSPEALAEGLKDEEGVGLNKLWSTFNRNAASQGILASVLMDVVLSSSDWENRDGGKAGAYVGRRDNQDGDWQGFYLVQDNQGRWKVRVLPEEPEMVGEVVLEYLAAGRLEDAGTWLDWFFEDNVDQKSSSVFENPLRVLWRSGDPRDKARMTLAAQGILLKNPELLESELPRADRDTGTALRLILSDVYEATHRPGLRAQVLEPLVGANPREERLLSRYLGALREAGEHQKAQDKVRALLEQFPRDAGIQRQALYLYVTGLNFQNLQDLLKKYNPRLEGLDYNNMAWMSLFQDTITDQALEWGRKAVTLTGSRSRATLHTMATLYAETGRLEEARKILDQSMSLGWDLDPVSEDWYVLGLVAEGYGFQDAARQAYQRVEVPKNQGDLAETWNLAKRRLARLAK